MARYRDRRVIPENFAELTQIESNAKEAWMNAYINKYNIIAEIQQNEGDNESPESSNRILDATQLCDRLYEILRQAKDNIRQSLHAQWYPVYCLYAEDHDLKITEENYLSVCNEHFANEFLSSGQIIPCDCNYPSLALEVDYSEHTYTIGAERCSLGTEVYVCFVERNEYGFIAEDNPNYWTRRR